MSRQKLSKRNRMELLMCIDRAWNMQEALIKSEWNFEQQKLWKQLNEIIHQAEVALYGDDQ